MLRKSSGTGLEASKHGRGLVFKVGDPPPTITTGNPRKVGVSLSLEAGVLNVTDTHLQRAAPRLPLCGDF